MSLQTSSLIQDFQGACFCSLLCAIWCDLKALSHLSYFECLWVALCALRLAKGRFACPRIEVGSSPRKTYFILTFLEIPEFASAARLLILASSTSPFEVESHIFPVDAKNLSSFVGI
jgi:hypothetical protein